MNKIKNILFITTDQQRRDSLPCYGQDFMITPALDKLATEGMVFDRAYSLSPICQPARASLITGQYPHVNGVCQNFQWISPETPTIAELFNEAGWKTAAIGKMHFYPWDNPESFQDRIIAEDKRHVFLNDDWTKFLHEQGYERDHPHRVKEYDQTGASFTSPLPEEMHIDSFIGSEAVKWLKSSPRKPFFCWVSFNSPHDPYDPPEPLSSLYDDILLPEPIGSFDDLKDKPDYLKKNLSQWSNNPLFMAKLENLPKEKFMEWRKKYYATISLIDKQIENILKTLDEQNLTDETLIVFSSDHGDLLGDHGLPFKNNFFEGSLGVPLIIRGPGVTPGTRNKTPVNWADLFSSFLSAADIRVPDHSQGLDITAVFSNPELIMTDISYSELNDKAMIMKDQYKLIYGADGRGELYNLKEDPHEQMNLFDNISYSEICRNLINRMLQIQLSHSSVRRFGGGTHPAIPERETFFQSLKKGEYVFYPQK